ncbi:hypothetical protein O181_042995 [Austropuccinia psidii MF-1]|uniref:Uncharacterized protein n=1 Tax=Austropuccinia psidii MF-1 TaxID=1389203 RepID=A0A9Q3DHM5_9BASI|nr:hypothetical protein [Austropuccinia psidii MF-1]
MNFGYHSSAQPFSLASSLGPELNDLLNSQADQIQQLQQHLEARDQEFEILLSQVNDLHVQNQNQKVTKETKPSPPNKSPMPQNNIGRPLTTKIKKGLLHRDFPSAI